MAKKTQKKSASKPAKTATKDKKLTTKAPPAASNNSAAAAATAKSNHHATPSSAPARRLLPAKSELKDLYKRYTEGSAFDEHDKAFYFVLDVGGVSRAKQLLAHVEEVLAELEEFE